MKKLITFIICINYLSAYSQKDNRIIIGTVDTISSKVLSEKRTIQIHVPDGGKDNHYPVLYILDGEEHFLSAVAITEQLSGLLPPMIVVGINNMGHGYRERDLTPTKVSESALVNAGDARLSGGGEMFFSFMEKELIPYIDSTYPTAGYR